jgi:septum formation protein
MSTIQVYLASTSPRRQALLEQLGLCFQSLPVAVDETPLPREQAANYVKRLAASKAQIGRSGATIAAGIPVLAADTCIVHQGRIIGKPDNREQAIEILSQLSGRTHEVYSAVAVSLKAIEGNTDKPVLENKIKLSVSRVTFRTLQTAEIQGYCETDEPMGKAGGYAIQGRAAAFIRHLEGSYSGVMGLPLYETAELLHGVGIKLFTKG